MYLSYLTIYYFFKALMLNMEFNITSILCLPQAGVESDNLKKPEPGSVNLLHTLLQFKNCYN